ncbi:unnamed protein product [Prorocentrum cordatum]|uniref:Uncharacterized protein n=1 Tax=Prorocentrum cordatum TaxID=2364126 RepID=A0ABN9TBM4_9DINO|nr:unnamed protein product [Polarella glacialis]
MPLSHGAHAVSSTPCPRRDKRSGPPPNAESKASSSPHGKPHCAWLPCLAVSVRSTSKRHRQAPPSPATPQPVASTATPTTSSHPTAHAATTVRHPGSGLSPAPSADTLAAGEDHHRGEDAGPTRASAGGCRQEN